MTLVFFVKRYFLFFLYKKCVLRDDALYLYRSKGREVHIEISFVLLNSVQCIFLYIFAVSFPRCDAKDMLNALSSFFFLEDK